jgi:hypothetical protein
MFLGREILTVAPFEIFQINPPLRSETEEKGLQAQVLIGQRFGARYRRFSVGESLQVSSHGTAIPPALSVVEGVGGGAEAKVGGVVPVFGVVAGAETVFTGEIGDLIMQITGAFKDLGGSEKNRD